MIAGHRVAGDRVQVVVLFLTTSSLMHPFL